jgi:hypothetical protein
MPYLTDRKYGTALEQLQGFMYASFSFKNTEGDVPMTSANDQCCGTVMVYCNFGSNFGKVPVPDPDNI